MVQDAFRNTGQWQGSRMRSSRQDGQGNGRRSFWGKGIGGKGIYGASIQFALALALVLVAGSVVAEVEECSPGGLRVGFGRGVARPIVGSGKTLADSQKRVEYGDGMFSG
jgi:hypothetical protein